MRNTTIGILAHVDAGKTTLSESILFTTGTLRKRGRVDHGDAFLDTDEMEKKRGITIYSKLARFSYAGRSFTILDTPGHADFSPEMERALRVLDVAVLVVSAADVIHTGGADPQVRILWRLLRHYHVPTFLFVNKMDQQADKEEDIKQIGEKIYGLLSKNLGRGLVHFDKRQLCKENEEAIAVCQDALLEKVLEGGDITQEDVHSLISKRLLFPVYFGAALQDIGTLDLLEGLVRYTGSELNQEEGHKKFGAIVYKITREENTRLTWMKITGGEISVRENVREVMSGNEKGTDLDAGEDDFSGEEPAAQEVFEKISEIRLYSGERYTAVKRAGAGEIVAVTGLSYTHAGDGLGEMESSREEILTPILTSRVEATDLYGKKVDDFTLMKALKGLEEQEPMLHVEKEEETGEITVRIMGEVQTQILTGLLRERYGLRAQFGKGSIVYRETIRRSVEGVGHFEPLRHYAEVHVVLEPLEPGSGLVFENHCMPNTLEKNWQNLIMTHLSEKTHRGVLTGAAITDMRISLVGGKASKKHTSGGDFRKATYAAVRQGLMSAENILLEPVLSFRMELPAAYVGRAMTDISQMYGTLRPAEFMEECAVLKGSIPASELGDYAQTLAGYTGGSGHLSISLKGYEPCHNTRDVMDAKAYDPELDSKNPTYSVFCSHGAGTVVPWNRVREYMHVDTGWEEEDKGGPYLTDDYYTFEGDTSQKFEIDRGDEEPDVPLREQHAARRKETTDFKQRQRAFYAGEEELTRIFERTYGPVKRNLHHPDNEKYFGTKIPFEETGEGTQEAPERESQKKRTKSRQEMQDYLLVDGYNIIFAWEDLKELAAVDIMSARDKLLDILSGYAGYCGQNIIVVFDAYRVSGGKERVLRFHNIDVVYTKEAETADLYIERTAHRLVGKHRVIVSTGDFVEQVIILGAGAERLSPRGLLEAILYSEEEMRRKYISE